MTTLGLLMSDVPAATHRFEAEQSHEALGPKSQRFSPKINAVSFTMDRSD